jgi:hypothetical protein
MILEKVKKVLLVSDWAVSGSTQLDSTIVEFVTSPVNPVYNLFETARHKNAINKNLSNNAANRYKATSQNSTTLEASDAAAFRCDIQALAGFSMYNLAITHKRLEKLSFKYRTSNRFHSVRFAGGLGVRPPALFLTPCLCHSPDPWGVVKTPEP